MSKDLDRLLIAAQNWRTNSLPHLSLCSQLTDLTVDAHKMGGGLYTERWVSSHWFLSPQSVQEHTLSVCFVFFEDQRRKAPSE